MAFVGHQSEKDNRKETKSYRYPYFAAGISSKSQNDNWKKETNSPMQKLKPRIRKRNMCIWEREEHNENIIEGPWHSWFHN